jgi:hypothetical protein
MKQVKQRVVAIDYFRGVFILVVLLNHSAAFSMPFTYLGGASGLWTSAAELFLLLSGITLWIVRGDEIQDSFVATTKKIWRRAGIIYLANLLAVFLSLYLALLMVSHGLPNTVPGGLPSGNIGGVLFNTLIFRYTLGWAPFLTFYTVFLIFSPFALYALKKKIWPIVPLLSMGLYFISASQPGLSNTYYYLSIWQLYFVLGLVVAKFRLPILSWFYSLRAQAAALVRKTVLVTAGVTIGLSALLDFNIYPTAARMATEGWLPFKALGAYIFLLKHKPLFDQLFLETRTGLLRPAESLLILAALYIAYQTHKNWLLRRTGRFFINMGKDTLWIFVAQALAIPIITLWHTPRNNLAMNFILTSLLISLMWLVTKRQRFIPASRGYVRELKCSFNESKYRYLQQYEDIG